MGVGSNPARQFKRARARGLAPATPSSGRTFLSCICFSSRALPPGCLSCISPTLFELGAPKATAPPLHSPSLAPHGAVTQETPDTFLGVPWERLSRKMPPRNALSYLTPKPQTKSARGQPSAPREEF